MTTLTQRPLAIGDPVAIVAGAYAGMDGTIVQFWYRGGDHRLPVGDQMVDVDLGYDAPRALLRTAVRAL